MRPPLHRRAPKTARRASHDFTHLACVVSGASINRGINKRATKWSPSRFTSTGSFALLLPDFARPARLFGRLLQRCPCRHGDRKMLQFLSTLECGCKPTRLQSASRPRFRGVIRVSVFGGDLAWYAGATAPETAPELGQFGFERPPRLGDFRAEGGLHPLAQVNEFVNRH